MVKWKRQLVVGMLVMLFLSGTMAPVEAETRGADKSKATTASMLGDFLVLRPMGIAAQVVGLAFFVASLPISGATGNSKAVAQKMVVEPAEFTWKRPLGELP